MGDEGAGHFVKMVHNGIEYGDMQLICEAYHILRSIIGLTNDEISQVCQLNNLKSKHLKNFRLMHGTLGCFRLFHIDIHAHVYLLLQNFTLTSRYLMTGTKVNCHRSS